MGASARVLNLAQHKAFKHIHTRLESQAAHSSILSLVSEAAADEENHAFLCAKTAKNMGHHTGFEGNSKLNLPKT